MKALLLTVGSLALTAGVIANAYMQKKQFYPSVVYITKSNPSMAVSLLIFCVDTSPVITSYYMYHVTFAHTHLFKKIDARVCQPAANTNKVYILMYTPRWPIHLVLLKHT